MIKFKHINITYKKEVDRKKEWNKVMCNNSFIFSAGINVLC